MRWCNRRCWRLAPRPSSLPWASAAAAFRPTSASSIATSSRPPPSTRSWCGSRAAIRCCSAGRRKRSRRWQSAGVAFEVVPGVTSALAASAELGVSLTAARRQPQRCFRHAASRRGRGRQRLGARGGQGRYRRAVHGGRPGGGNCGDAGGARHVRRRRPSSWSRMLRCRIPADRLHVARSEERCRTDLTGPALLLFGDVFRKRAHALIGQALMADETPTARPSSPR